MNVGARRFPTVTWRWASLFGVFALGIAGGLVPSSARAQAEPLCFNVPGITNCIEGRFREFWEQNGGLAVFGYPITPARNEPNRDTGKTYLTQWFERNRFELHPENTPPYDVLLGRLGDDRLLQSDRQWQFEPRESTGPKPGCLWFEQTGHNVCDQAPNSGMRTYWETHGLSTTQLTPYQGSLALFGLPLTEPRIEINSSGDRVLTQWFERARFEWHPNKPVQFRVLLGLLGNEISLRIPPVTREFRSSSGRTIIQYYTYHSSTCGTGSNCNFRGRLQVPANFEQVEVFLSGFTLETHAQVDKVQRINAQVQKFLYVQSTGELEVGVSGQLSTASRQPYSYHITFVVILTDARAARFTPISTGCIGIATCSITRSLPGSIPSGMHYIGLGSRIFDLGSDSGPLEINALAAHIDNITVSPPDTRLSYDCALRDASQSNRMFCEWASAVIAFDPAEMEQNTSTIFPQYTFIGSHVTSAQRWANNSQTRSMGPISGFLDAFEGVIYLYDPGQQYPIWMVESSARNFRMSGTPPNTAITDYGIFLGTTFGDRNNARPYTFQESRAMGLLR
jgi:hypothetical protein